MTKANYFVVIPADVRYNKDLTANAKILFGEIAALSNKEGVCWASNSYFANLYDTSVVSVSRWFSQLEKAGLIETKMVFDSKEKKVTKRLTKMIKHSNRINKNVKKGVIINVKDNTSTCTSINNTSNNVEEFSDLEKQCYKNVIPLFKEDYRPKTKAQKLKWIQAIKKLNDKEGINPRQTYYIIKKTLEDPFWIDNFRSPLKLLRPDKNGVKWVYVFKNKYAKDMIV